MELRKEARNCPYKDKTFTSARNLLGILRLSTALARLRLADSVHKKDIDEAIRLVIESKVSINETENEPRQSEDNRRRNIIYNIVKDLAGRGSEVLMQHVLERCLSKGYKQNEIEEVIEFYADNNIWHVSMNGTRITLVN